MKKQQFLPVVLALTLLLLIACKPQPRHPETMKIPVSPYSVRDYLKSEYEYAEEWLDQYSSIRSLIKAELSARSFKLPNKVATKTDTASMENGLWKAFIKDRKELHALSGKNFKTDHKLVSAGNDSVFIEDFLVVNLQCLVLVLSNNLTTSLEINDIFINKKSGVENKINFPEPEGRISDLSYDKENDRLMFVYSSSVTPPTCYTYGIHSMRLGILWKTKVRQYAREDYKAEILRIPAKNKEMIPVSILRKTDTGQPEGPSPLIIFADYQNQGKPEISFNSGLLSLLNRGFTIVQIHIPADDSTIQSGYELISYVVSDLCNRHLTSQGLITIAGSDSAAGMAYLTAKEHPSWFKTLVIENPASLTYQGTIETPSVFLFSAYNNTHSENLIAAFASEYRKNEKSENILLLSKGKNQKKDRSQMGDMITFILASYSIDK